MVFKYFFGVRHCMSCIGILYVSVSQLGGKPETQQGAREPRIDHLSCCTRSFCVFLTCSDILLSKTTRMSVLLYAHTRFISDTVTPASFDITDHMHANPPRVSTCGLPGEHPPLSETDSPRRSFGAVTVRGGLRGVRQLGWAKKAPPAEGRSDQEL